MYSTTVSAKRSVSKKHKNSPIVECLCGCGKTFKKVDKEGRTRKFLSGHNTPKKYDDPREVKRAWNHRNRKKRFQSAQVRARNLKSDLLREKGGKCEHCAYVYDGKNAPAFDFHHVPERGEKKFNVGVSSLHNYSLKRNWKEAEKCIILCAVCHRLHHSSEY